MELPSCLKLSENECRSLGAYWERKKKEWAEKVVNEYTKLVVHMAVSENGSLMFSEAELWRGIIQEIMTGNSELGRAHHKRMEKVNKKIDTKLSEEEKNEYKKIMIRVKGWNWDNDSGNV